MKENENNRTYLEYLANVIQLNWNKPALVDYSPNNEAVCFSYTFGEMYQQVDRIGRFLKQLNIHEGDHVALCGANSSHWMIGYLAVASIGAVNASILHTSPAASIVSLLTFADAKVLLTDSNIWKKISTEHLPEDMIVVSLETWEVLRGSVEAKAGEANLSLRPEDVKFNHFDWNLPAQLCFTSGTSEKAKGVVASWKNITCNVLCVSENYKATNNRTMLSVFPLGHTLAIVGEFLVQLHQGCTVYVMREYVEPNTLLDAYLKIKPYEIVLVPLVVERFLSEQYIERFKQVISFLDVGVVCGAKLKKEQEEQLQQLHFPLTIPYGMTECSPIVTIATPANFEPFSSGRACRFMEIKTGANNEILVKGDNVMLGYYKDEKATREKIDPDGWMHSGDCGEIDANGNLFVQGRINKDMLVLPSGENVSPSSVESVINAMPDVEESIVVLRNGHLIGLIYTKRPENCNQILLSDINKKLPLYSQLFAVECLTEPLQRTEKQNIKRYLYN